MSDEAKVNFEGCLMECANTPELVKEFDRLYGCQLSTLHLRSPITRMVDEATGFERDQLRKFVAFVFRFVWVPMASVPLPEPPKP